MKKFIVALITALILLPSIADAQIRTISNIRMGQVRLNHTNDGYYMVMKTNHILDYNDFTVHLGFNKEEALKLLDRMLEIHVEESPFTFSDAYGMTFYFTNYKTRVSIRVPEYYGRGELTRSELNKIRKKIENDK